MTRVNFYTILLLGEVVRSGSTDTPWDMSTTISNLEGNGVLPRALTLSGEGYMTPSPTELAVYLNEPEPMPEPEIVEDPDLIEGTE